jgi:ATP-binding cassette subfamily B protein
MTAPSISAEFTLPQRRKTLRQGPVQWLASHAIHYWNIALLVLAGAIGNAALAAAIPILVGQAFNALLETPSQPQSLVRISLLIVASQVSRSFLQFGRNFGAELIGQRMERDIRDELYVSLLGKSMTFHSLQPVGDTMARATNDVREINLMFSPGLNLVIGSAIFLLLPLIVGPRYHPQLALVPALFIISYVLALGQYLNELQPITQKIRDSFGTLNSRLAEAIDGIETVKGAAQEDAEVVRFEKNAKRYRDGYVRQGNVEARFLPLLLMGLAQAGGLFHAILLYRQGLLEVGDIVAYFGLLLLFGFPTFVSLFAYSQVSLGIASARRILELINRENNLDQNVAGFKGDLRGAIVFRNVCFSYSAQEPVLENIFFEVEPGQTVAIVGQTGSGKTSLVKLVNRTHDVDCGSVFVDGINVANWNLETLRRNISIIEQDIFLFSRTIAENIAFGKPHATQAEIETAAQAAQAHEFILEFKDGYQTVIGERGVTLSGGQRQRLALARAFLTDPRILILDDSTSSIDSATEDKIQRAIYTAARGRTTLIITHRLSQIRWADQIIVLRKGRIAAIGKHEDLLKTSPAYRRIFADEKSAASQGSPER